MKSAALRRKTSRLSLESLEPRHALAGLIDVVFEPAGGHVSIHGDDQDNHVRVEHVAVDVNRNLYQISVSSTSGPMRFLNSLTGDSIVTESPIVLPAGGGGAVLDIDTGKGNDAVEVSSTARPNGSASLDWMYLSIQTGNGDDQVQLDDLQAPLGVFTGHGADRVLLRECDGHISDPIFSDAFIDTGFGDDRVDMVGSNNYVTMLVYLGAGDDVLAGDPEAILALDTFLAADGGNGFDRLLNADYFHADERPWAFPWFEDLG
jgi:hypothetical protein